MSDLKSLKKEADDLGITYSGNIGQATLQKKIDEAYDAQETSGPALQESMKEAAVNEGTSTSKEVSEKERLALKAKEREKRARATRIVTIIDNDQRVNNQTTTCVVNCSNQYFDLGTAILPLNEKIEVQMGHIRTLESVKIPLHMRDNNTGLATVRLRPRYTISYEDIK